MTDHPFYPRDLVLPEYVPKILSTQDVLFYFFVPAAIIIVLSFLLYPRSGLDKRLFFCWFVFCGFCHTFFEGYFVFFSQSLGSRTDIVADMWKEYSSADSRYVTKDPTIISVEGITAVFVGPLCFYTAYAIYTKRPIRHVLEILVAVPQVYGVIVYFVTSGLDGFPHTAPDPLNFWFYFAFMNGIWAVVPLLSIRRSIKSINRALLIVKKNKPASTNKTIKKTK
eukprot:TRINITY_DN18045_c0_g1_i1.p1 TRINITY_DN18045_c0_g1~~TRINITY_DN18045_c0_g1_i1.p1  ORF type:complete len:224 (-),score=28.94 TRINITY_DN18045_c0_g1_i1:41-712(-)